MKLLLDEQLSPAIVSRLHERGHEAQHVSHIGLSGAPDHRVWKEAFERDATVVTVNAEDFLELAEGAELHCGLIVIRYGALTGAEQLEWVLAAIEWFEQHPCDLANRVIEVRGATDAEIESYLLPP